MTIKPPSGSLLLVWTFIVNDLYLAFTVVQLLSCVDHSSAHSFGVTSLSPNSPSCVLSAVWDRGRPLGQLRQTRLISSSRRTTLFITAQPASNHLVDETQHHPSVTTLEAGVFIWSITSTTLTSANAWVYPHPSNFAEPVSPLPSSLRITQYQPNCSFKSHRGPKFITAFLHS